jgi:tetratricopeptide (TPR) repeat protein
LPMTARRFVVALAACAGCAHAAEPLRPVPPPSSAPVAAEATPPRSRPAEPEVRNDAPPVNQQDQTRAQELAAAGQRAFLAGDYKKAEQTLREAVTLFPFLPSASLTLGKIYLLRAEATREASLLASARQMFEMAHSLDPTNPEPQQLLDLLKASRVE